jgi:hypothetical protein
MTDLQEIHWMALIMALTGAGCIGWYFGHKAGVRHIIKKIDAAEAQERGCGPAEANARSQAEAYARGYHQLQQANKSFNDGRII